MVMLKLIADSFFDDTLDDYEWEYAPNDNYEETTIHTWL